MSEETRSEPADLKALVKAIRASSFLDPTLKRRWLTLLPHMGEEERRDLWSILVEGERRLGTLGGRENG